MSCKVFHSMQFFFRIVNVYHFFLILNTLTDEVDRGLGHEKKKHGIKMGLI